MSGRRAAVPGLRSPDPLGRRLPAVYAADELAQRMTDGFDQVLAPVQATLDSLWAYLSPALAPEDFVDWLGGWVGATAGPDRPVGQRRVAVSTAIATHRIRGTAAGLRAEIRDVFGVEAEIVESGGTSWSATPGTALPGSAEPDLLVRVRVGEPSNVFVERLREFVEGNRPAHVPCRVEVLPL
ncbi:phage tail protein [Actinoplanes teichomyceticus]|uniref:Phage tail-like protein n=1 Tax=Actinoplanes teichomyceticus TaxID=1867 RepID=A0A561WLK2_ACTTI|nr:phage tail protein [Actinoplanes teichomyceticus]TWG24744.1 phage tail-like protein [Actinoplanes teichomyceticus]GIF14593.1 tail protein [Actinoplanes teichomyceticus]